MSKRLSGLRSQRSTLRLEQIANLRARGIGEHVNLPQLVACGDQSSGKSSVLEGITGIPFPRQDGLCTRFPTEIILTHTDGPLIIEAEVIPSSSASADARKALSAIKRTLGGYDELPQVIEDVSMAMGLRRPDGTPGPTFGNDILRIKVSGSTGLHLTVVDLPGLISTPDEDQVDEDVQIVHSLVDSYLRNPRTIILAVVQAGNDIANQAIIQKARKFDPSGQRTIGVITKPDLINEGTESRIAQLSKNLDKTKLKLGFFLVKNPSPQELKDAITSEGREQMEIGFFTSPPWSELSLDRDRVGIIKLREYLQRLLDRHIERELPGVRSEIQRMLKRIREEVSALGEERPTTAHQRMYLSRLSMRFHNLTMAALQGDYHTADAQFLGGGYVGVEGSNANRGAEYLRLRALIHNLNTQFSDDMRLYGSTLKVAGASVPDHKAKDGNMSGQDEISPVGVGGETECLDFSDAVTPIEGVSDYETLELGQKRVTEKVMKAFVLRMYRQTRGRELPGNFNHVLLAELFHYQSKRWKAFASSHMLLIAENLSLFMKAAIEYLSKEETVRKELFERVETALSHNKVEAEKELDRLWADCCGQPITYNHYYTDNVQKARHDTTRALLKKALRDTSTEEYNKKFHVSNTTVDFARLESVLQQRVLVNMDEQACSEARAGLDAFYLVARKSFVDNVCTQVVERHLLRTLPNCFPPEMVAGMSEEELQRIAGEEEGTVLKRKQLLALSSSLSASLEDLRNA